MWAPSRSLALKYTSQAGSMLSADNPFNLGRVLGQCGQAKANPSWTPFHDPPPICSQEPASAPTPEPGPDSGLRVHLMVSGVTSGDQGQPTENTRNFFLGGDPRAGVRACKTSGSHKRIELELDLQSTRVEFGNCRYLFFPKPFWRGLFSLIKHLYKTNDELMSS